MALINTAGRGWGKPGSGGRSDRAGRGGRGGHGEQDKRNKKDDGDSNNEGREFSNVNNEGQLGCWNCGNKKHWKYQCPKLTAEERAELRREGGSSLLSVVNAEDNIYGAKDECNGVTFVLLVMVQRRKLNPHYLYLDS